MDLNELLSQRVAPPVVTAAPTAEPVVDDENKSTDPAAAVIASVEEEFAADDLLPPPHTAPTLAGERAAISTPARLEGAKIAAKKSDEDLFTEQLNGFSLEALAEDWDNNQAVIDALLEDASIDQLKRWRLEITTVNKDANGEALSDNLKTIKGEILAKINAKLSSMSITASTTGPQTDEVASAGEVGAKEKILISQKEVERRAEGAKKWINELVVWQSGKIHARDQFEHHDLADLTNLVAQFSEVKTIGEFNDLKNRIVTIVSKYGYKEIIDPLFE